MSGLNDEVTVVIDERDAGMADLRMDVFQAAAMLYVRDQRRREKVLKDYVMSAEPYRLHVP